MANRNTASEGQTEIQAGTTIKGLVQGNEDLLVGGRIEGRVELEGRLVVEAGAVIKAEVRAHRVSIVGTVVGNVTASEVIEIAASGRVQGDLRAPTVRIDDGARLSGLLEVGDVSRIQVAPRTKESKAARKAAAANLAAAPAPSDDRRRKRVVVKKRG